MSGVKAYFPAYIFGFRLQILLVMSISSSMLQNQLGKWYNAHGSGWNLPQVQKQLNAHGGPVRHLDSPDILNVQKDQLFKTKIPTINFSKYGAFLIFYLPF